jgi:hypothetical protein
MVVEISENGEVIIPVYLWDDFRYVKFRFMIDTGCSVVVIDKRIMLAFCIEDDISILMTDAVGDTASCSGGFLKCINIAGIRKTDVLAVVEDLGNGIGAFQDAPVDGILGMSFLSGTRFVLDVPGEKIEWWRVIRDPSHVLPIQYDRGRLPFVTLSFGGKEVPCLVDSGSMGGFELPGNLKPSGPGPGAPVVIRGIFGGTSQEESKGIEALVSGEAQWVNVSVVFRKDWGSGTLGLDVLSAGPVCFDFIADHLSFPSAKPTEGDLPLLRPGRTSIPLAWDRSSSPAALKVYLVKPDSPMEKAGCMPGDVLVRVGPLQGKALTRRSVMDWMAKGIPHAWFVRRDGVLKELQFR